MEAKILIVNTRFINHGGQVGDRKNGAFNFILLNWLVRWIKITESFNL